jgi:RNA polymerase sigma-70 factor (ECF subfamily)
MEAVTAKARAMSDADLDLAERHRYGDEAAFEEIYQRFGAMVYNLALRLSGEPEEAADLSQETFLKVHRHLGGFRGRSSLKTWVYRVALNCCRSRYRSREAWRNRISSHPEERLEVLADSRRNPEDRAIARSTAEQVEKALAQLKPIFREAVFLRDIEGLSYEEISEVLGQRLGTVRSRIARGRNKLRELLEVSP